MDIELHGSGPVRVVVVPGGPGLPNEAYRELIDGLSRAHTVVTYRQWGSHPRPLTDYPHTVEEYADELSDVVRTVPSGAEGGQPIVLLGHSFGAAVVLEALLRGVPAAGAVIMSGYTSGEMIKAGIGARVADLPDAFHRRRSGLEAEDGSGIAELLFEYWIPVHFCRVVPMPESLQYGFANLNPHLQRHFLGGDLMNLQGEMLKWDREAAVGSLRLPVLFTAGEFDYLTHDQLYGLQRSIPDSELWIGPTTSHCGWFEDPDAYFNRITTFIAERCT